MQVYINKANDANSHDWKLAALKQDTSFQYVAENRLFGGGDGYSLTITLPLKDCPQNQAIFGHINRADVAARKVIFDCEIRDKSFSKFGCITITEISETEVKVQFLDGRSEQNFDKTLDKIYINELDLGEPPTTSKLNISPANAWVGLASGSDAVALPWVNEASKNIQNKPVYVPEQTDGQGHVLAPARFDWHEDTLGLSWQPYLIFITKKICEAIGYAYDFSQWEAKEDYKYLLICNALPFSWYVPHYARALPHWSVQEYFEKLELFMGCEFNFDHRAKNISFAFTRDIVQSKAPIKLDDIVEEHTTTVKVEDNKCDYSEAKNLAYKESDNSMSKYYSCDWFIRAWAPNAIRYDTLTELLEDNSNYANWDGKGSRESRFNSLYYAADVDMYFIIRSIDREEIGLWPDRKTKRWKYKCVLQPLNVLGPRIVDDSDEAQTDEIEFVPARIDYTEADYGFQLFNSFSGYDEEITPTSASRGGAQPFTDEWYEEINSRFAQSQPDQLLEAGKKEEKAEYYDRIYIGWWDGALRAGATRPPHPFVENIEISDDWNSYYQPRFSMRINDGRCDRYSLAMPIEPAKKSTFKFLADKIPDPRAIYIIRGKRYVCEKITATFTEKGMSQLIKGDFYEVKEECD